MRSKIGKQRGVRCNCQIAIERRTNCDILMFICLMNRHAAVVAADEEVGIMK